MDQPTPIPVTELARSRPRGRLRQLCALVLSAVVTAAGLTVPSTSASAASDLPLYTIEGESAASHNFAPGVAADPNASGRQYLRLFATTPPPAEGYVATYSVTVPDTGGYALTIVSTPPVDGRTHREGYASPYDLSVNGATFTRVSGAGAVDRFTFTGYTSMLKYNLGTVQLQAGTNTIAFRVNTHRADDANFLMFLDYFTLGFPGNPVVEVNSGGHPLNVFEASSIVQLNVVLDHTVTAATDIHVQVVDYSGSTVLDGIRTVPAGGRQALVDLFRRPTGGYLITARAAGSAVTFQSSFAVVPDYATRRPVTGSPLALDTAFPWRLADASAPNDPAYLLTNFPEVMKLSGIKQVRGRFDLNAVAPSQGTYTFDEQVYGPWIAAMANAGLDVFLTYQATPAWTRQSTNGVTHTLPVDLLSFYDIARRTAANYGSQVDAWEVWNEVEHGNRTNGIFCGLTSCADTADYYAALLKVASIGYADAGLPGGGPAVVMSGSATVPYQPTYPLVENDISLFTDVYNYHGHRVGDRNSEVNEYNYQFTYGSSFTRAQAGLTGKPFWCGECGGFLQSRPSDGITNDLDHRAQVLQARHAVVGAIDNLAQGVDRFYFYLARHDAGTVGTFEMFSDNAETPYFSYPAVAVMTQALGQAQYQGTINGLPAGATGHVFKDGTDSVGVIWSPTTATTSLSWGVSSAEQTTFMGRVTTVNAAGGALPITIGPDPVYVRIPGNLPAAAISDKPHAVVQPNPAARQSALTVAQRVVVRQNYDSSVSTFAKPDGYPLSDTTANPVTVDVFNLNPTTQTITVGGSANHGWTVSPSDRTVVLPPYSSASLQYEVTAGAAIQTDAQVTFQPRLAGLSGSRSVAYIRNPARAVSGAPAQFPGTDGIVEGEWANSHNFRWGASYHDALRGDRYLQLETPAAAPMEGYIATFDVTVPTAGNYSVIAASTPPYDGAAVTDSWSSPYDISVNGGSYQRVTGAQKLGEVFYPVSRYRIGTISLNAGANTISFRVNQRPSLNFDDLYLFWLDYFQLTRV